MTDDLVAFLRARLDEDAMFAREARARGWLSTDNYIEDHNGGEVARFEIKADARHAAGWSPTRVLAEVEVKRRIVKLLDHEPTVGIRNVPEPEEYVSCVCGWQNALSRGFDWKEPYQAHLTALGVNYTVADTLLRLLALSYADHPDYRQEWKP